MISGTGTARLSALWTSMVAVAIVAAIPRFYWMLSGSYNAVVIIFIAFTVLPFLILEKSVRGQIGFVRMPIYWVPAAFVIGALTALLVYLVGYWMFGNSDLNWFVVIMKTFDRDGMIEQVRPNVFLFLAVSTPVMIFSPLGEEFFFRGLLHESFASRFSLKHALVVDASFFGTTHLAHYGLSVENGSLSILPSAVIWILLMAFTAVIFYQIKRISGSIWGAALCHSGFNFAMMAIIFYVIR